MTHSQALLRTIGGIFVALIFSGCYPTRIVENSGALHSVDISLDDPEVVYEELSGEYSTGSFGGFMNNRGFEDFAAETSIMSNNNGSNTFSFSYGPRNGLKFLTFSATALGLSYFYNGILNKDEDFDAFLVLPGIVSALALNEAIWRPYNHQQYKAYSTRLLLDQSPHAHFFCFPASEVVVSQGLFNTQWSGSNRIVSGNAAKIFPPY
jgi:hypothetical protein